MNALLLSAAILLASCTARPADAAQYKIDATPPAAPTRTETPVPTGTSTQAADTATPSPTPGIPAFSDETMQAQMGRLAAQFMQQTRNPGLSVALLRRNPQTGQPEAMLLNFGTRARDGGGPVDSNTEYEIGSITKVFTGILLAEAVNDGKMQLGDPIQNYLPEGVQAPNYKGTPITLAELATHRSGLPRDLNSDSLADLYEWLNGFHLSRAPGSEYVYSNLGYSLLGDILARNANTDFGTLAFQSVSQPLGLTDTTETLSDDQTNRLAEGYTYDGSLARYFPQTGAMSGAGYLHSTLTDLTRFLVENMEPNSTPLGASLTLAQTMQSEGRNPGTGTGLGWEIEGPGKPDGRVWKGGGTPGFSSYISFANDGRWGFVLLSNGQFIDNLVPGVIRLLNESSQ